MNKYSKNFIISQELKKEIENYKNIVTNIYDTTFPKNYIQREHSFNDFTLRNIKYFIKYLNEEKNIEICDICSLKNYLNDYLVDYTKYLIRCYNTQTPQIRTRNFIGMMKYFYRETDKDLIGIENEYRELISRHYVTCGNRGINLLYNLPDIDEVLQLLYIDELRYKFIFNILIRLGWRSRNIITMTYGENIYNKNSIWFYNFAPEQQKFPLKSRNKYLSIIGKMPQQIIPLLEEYLDVFEIKKGDPVICRITDKNKVPINNSNFYRSLIKAIKRNYPNMFPIGAHAFRTIIANNFANSTNDFLLAEVWLWHKVKLSSSMYNYVIPDINLAVNKVNEYIDSLITENSPSPIAR